MRPPRRHSLSAAHGGSVAIRFRRRHAQILRRARQGRGGLMSEQSFDRDAVREAILDAALPHVPFDGWTQATLQHGAADAGHDKVMALRVFPGGPVEAVE